jgi:hypothetical protein
MTNTCEVEAMRVSSWFAAPGAMLMASMMLCLSGCVVHDREVVPDRGSTAYNQGYKEGYYDREHNRWWHDQAWHDCVENDIHCR